MIRIRLPSTVNRPRGAKSGMSPLARDILERTRRAKVDLATEAQNQRRAIAELQKLRSKKCQ